MLDEFVIVAQAVAVEYAVVVHDDGVVEAATQCQAAGAHHLDIAGEAEGTGSRNIADVTAAGHVERHALAGGIHRGVGEVDFELQAKAVVWLQSRPFSLGAFAFTNLHRTQDANKLFGRALFHNARALQQVDERCRGAVENGYFFGRDVDVEIVQPQPGAG